MLLPCHMQSNASRIEKLRSRSCHGKVGPGVQAKLQAKPQARAESSAAATVTMSPMPSISVSFPRLS